MRTKPLDPKPPLVTDVAETPSPQPPPATNLTARETPAEVREFQKKHAGAPSRPTSDVPTGGDAAIKFFTARGSYDSHLLSQPLRQELAGAFGEEGVPFFDLYYRFEAMARDAEAPRPKFKELKEQVDGALAGLGKTDAGSGVLNRIWSTRRWEDETGSFDEILQRASRRHAGPTQRQWSMLSEFFQSAIGTLAREKGVSLTLGTNGTKEWPSLRLLSAREKQLDQIRAEDPMAFHLIMERREFYRDRDSAISRAIGELDQGHGVTSRKAMIRRRLVTVADVIGEAGQAKSSWIFDIDAKRRSFDEHISWREKLSAAKDELSRPDEHERAERVLTDFQLSSLRVLDDAALPLLPGPMELHGVTDQTSTRSLATKMHEGQRIVVEGRYAGIPVESLVDPTGRLIESVIDEPGRHEPYLWHDEKTGKLVLDFPNKRGEWTAMRQRLRALAQQEEAIEYKRIDFKQPRFTFPVQFYEEIEKVISFARRTSGASAVIEGHFAAQAKLDAATRTKDLERFSAQSIGGFQPGAELHEHQKQALAYLEANGGHGVINLDTGDGKTLVAISQMMISARNGELDRPSSNGRFLFVCNPDHRGNLRDQIETFCDEDTRKLLLSSIHDDGTVRRRGRVDVMSYGEFQRASDNGRWKGKPWSPHEYATGFFDEVHKRLEHKNATSEAICRMQAPKVLLTASLVGKNPAQALKIRHVSEGVDLFSANAEDVRREIQKVSRYLSVRVGPHEVGINPERKMRAKQIFEGIFYRKRQPLGVDLVPSQERLTMQAPVQRAYESVLASDPDLRAALQGSTSLWRDAGAGAAERRRAADGSTAMVADPLDPRIASINAINSELKAKHELLIDLENRPNHFALVGERLIDLSATESEAPQLIEYNPKLRAAAERFADKLDRSPESRAAQLLDDKRLVEEAALEMLAADVPGGHAACLPDRIVVYRHATDRAIAAAQAEADKNPKTTELAIVRIGEQPVIKLTHRATTREFQTEMLKNLQEMMRSLSEDTSIRTLSLYRPTYGHGHNIQKGLIDTVIDLTPPKGHQSGHQSLSRFWRQGTEVESVEHVTVSMGLDRTEGEGMTLTRFDVLPGEIQQARNAREKSIFEDSVAAVDEQGHYSGLPPDTKSSLIQSRRIFQLERELANGDRVL